MQYQQMHLHGEAHLGIPPEQTFPGKSLPQQAGHIKHLILHTGAKTLLDYGCGKGQQYLPQRLHAADEGIDYPDMKSYWGAQEIRCYDPAYPPFMEVPSGVFDGVVCTDVLEHCPEEDIPWILDELFAYAHRFVFANIACFPARKRLPSGGNAHCTIRPVKWWRDEIERAARPKPELAYEFRLAHIKAGSMKERIISTLSRVEEPDSAGTE
jgi:hypothetical protein